MNLRQRDKKYFGRQGPPRDVVVGNSADSYLTDARGQIHRREGHLEREGAGCCDSRE